MTVGRRRLGATPPVRARRPLAVRGPRRPLPRRIVVLGSGGAGKSTLATRIGAATGLPVVHLDRVYFSPGWVEPPADEWEATVRQLVARPTWVLDGNYGDTAHLRIDAADLVVLMDTPRWRCLWRVARRRWTHRGTNRPDMADGCHERLDPTFLRWVWIFPRHKRPRYVQELFVAHERGREAVRLRSRTDADALVADLADRARHDDADASATGAAGRAGRAGGLDVAQVAPSSAASATTQRSKPSSAV